ncbi:MAG: methyltransferase domain-containing protein [Pseudomonadota bacterium]
MKDKKNYRISKRSEFSEVNDEILFALSQPYLIRKSFEYGEAFLCNPSIETLARSIQSKRPQSSNEVTDKYWDLEHARWLTISSQLDQSYASFLPGRIHTYRVLATHIVEKIDPRSMIDIGCGSGMMLHEFHKLGVAVNGLDKSKAALDLATALATKEYSYTPALHLGDALKNSNSLGLKRDLVSNLGSLEHLNYSQQLQFLRFMASFSKKYLLICIPNKKSTLFRAMEAAELSLTDSDLVYPEEFHQHDVDFARLRNDLSATLVEQGGIHTIPTSQTYGQSIDIMTGALYDPSPTDCANFEQRLLHAQNYEGGIEPKIKMQRAWFYFEVWDIDRSLYK